MEPTNRRPVGGAYRLLMTSHRPRPQEGVVLANTHPHTHTCLSVSVVHPLNNNRWLCCKGAWEIIFSLFHLCSLHNKVTEVFLI